jgi:starch phosphorylase
MDADLEANAPWDRELTGRLYGGDREVRLLQEILLGVGGMRLLRSLGLRPCIWHGNEGHTALMMVERLREHMESGLDFDRAVEAVRRRSSRRTRPSPRTRRVPFSLAEDYIGADGVRLPLGRNKEKLFAFAHDESGASSI